MEMEMESERERWEEAERFVNSNKDNQFNIKLQLIGNSSRIDDRIILN